MRVSDFYFDLPDELIARYPVPDRKSCRLLTLNGTTGELSHGHFSDVLDCIEEGDLVIFNNATEIDNTGFYISANANFAKTKMPFDSVDADLQPLERSGFTPAVAIGYDFGPVRTEINYEDLGTLTSSDPYIKGDLKVRNVGITTVYNFRPQADIQPYVGGRVMYTQFKADDQLTQSLAAQGIELKSNHMGLGVVGGVEYKVIDNLLVGVNANWDLLSGDPANSLGGGLTLRFKF